MCRVYACINQGVVTDEKTCNSLIDLIKKIPLLYIISTTRRVEALASEIFKTLLDKLRKAEVMNKLTTVSLK